MTSICARYVSVDVYGVCGSKRCPRAESDRCRLILNNDYKFYLSFENSICDQYITDKFFDNGLRSVLTVLKILILKWCDKEPKKTCPKFELFVNFALSIYQSPL